jgi:hypothetical protein
MIRKNGNFLARYGDSRREPESHYKHKIGIKTIFLSGAKIQEDKVVFPGF